MPLIKNPKIRGQKHRELPIDKSISKGDFNTASSKGEPDKVVRIPASNN